LILRGGTILSMKSGEAVFTGDIRIAQGRIVEIAPSILHRGTAEDEIDARGCLVLPGFVQAHIHLCQTLFRNMADDLELLDWLHQCIWPFEAWHSEESMRTSADLGLFELIAGGSTTILDMGSVQHTDSLFQAAEESGIRYFGGKCMMDYDDGHVPGPLLESVDQSIDESRALIERWHGAADGRLCYALAPRFAVSCSDELLRRVAELANEFDVLVHTHASENLGEIQAVKERTGLDNIRYLDSVGLLSKKTVLAHCVHLAEGEAEILVERETHVAHCPSSNLKLASGIANVPRLLEKGINVALGADGAPCNNRLDMFREMHLASLIQKPQHGPMSMPARSVLEMATIRGAQALGMDQEIGSLEVGKLADIIILDPGSPVELSGGDPYAQVVFHLGPMSVRDVMVAGRLLKRDFEMLTLDAAEIMENAESCWDKLKQSMPHLPKEQNS
jgi:5-methylthioadenosine/S-adenosylhomocysteine deaminase